MGLFDLIPVGQGFPTTEGAALSVQTSGFLLKLALQMAFPFVAFGIAWQLIMGFVARMGGRLQIYFASLPGQILFGLLIFMMTFNTIMEHWQSAAHAFLGALPGAH